MNKHIMIVDDDKDIREILNEVLSYEGFEVSSARNGEEALDKLDQLDEEKLPGCIFLDLNMPVMDGKTFLEKMGQRPEKLSDIPICVSSAGTEDKDCDLLHVSAYLPKPIDLNSLYSIAHHFCD